MSRFFSIPEDAKTKARWTDIVPPVLLVVPPVLSIFGSSVFVPTPRVGQFATGMAVLLGLIVFACHFRGGNRIFIGAEKPDMPERLFWSGVIGGVVFVLTPYLWGNVLPAWYTSSFGAPGKMNVVSVGYEPVHEYGSKYGIGPFKCWKPSLANIPGELTGSQWLCSADHAAMPADQEKIELTGQTSPLGILVHEATWKGN